MHELSVTENILRIALQHSDEGSHITDLYLVIGDVSSMVDESVQFYWDIISEGTRAQGAALHFKRVPAEMQCRDCHQVYGLREDRFDCPNCGSAAVRLIAGDEFYLEAINVETDTAGKVLT